MGKESRRLGVVVAVAVDLRLQKIGARELRVDRHGALEAVDRLVEPRFISEVPQGVPGGRVRQRDLAPLYLRLRRATGIHQRDRA